MRFLKENYWIWFLDIIVFLLIMLPAYRGYRKGFVFACLGFLPIAAAFLGARILSPFCSKWLRTTGLFSFFQEKIYQGLHLENLLNNSMEQSQTALIDQLALPDFLKSSLLENNNSVVHSLFKTEQLPDYIAGYFANICLNIISVALVAIIIYIVMKLLLQALNMVANLPVLSVINRSCGCLVGGIKGVCIVWFAGIIATLFYSNEMFAAFFAVLEKSHIAMFLYEHNILLLLVLKIFT